jgi:hypothetical protein
LLWRAANCGGFLAMCQQLLQQQNHPFQHAFCFTRQNRIASQKNSRKGKTKRNFELEVLFLNKLIWLSWGFLGLSLGLGFTQSSERERESMATSTSGSLLAYSGGYGLTKSSPLVPDKILPNCLFFILAVDAG